jgi:hypothetical protein
MPSVKGMRVIPVGLTFARLVPKIGAWEALLFLSVKTEQRVGIAGMPIGFYSWIKNIYF